MQRAARILRFSGATAFIFGLAQSLALACPMCKSAMEDNPVGTALSWTTLVLIALPVGLVASIGGWIGYVYWRAGRRPHAVAWSPVWREEESET